MTSSSVDRRVSSLTSVLRPAIALLLAAGCGSGGTPQSAGGRTSGGTTSNGGSTANGGTTGSGGTTSSGGTTGIGGTTSNGGTTETGGTTSTGGITSSGGVTGPGGTLGSGGVPASGGAGKGGTTGTGGVTGSGGISGRDGGPGSDGATGTGGATTTTDGGTVNCSATLPSGGQTCSGGNCNGTADGLGYGIWESGSGGSITYFTNAHAFSASWTSSSADFLAHLGLDFRPAKASSAYGTIVAEFSEVKKVTSNPPWSSIGMYGWMNSPCVEWYINEDSFNGLGGGGNITATIDGATYYLKTVQTTGTGGANACEGGHSGPWTQMISTRKTARQCGTITVTDHFAEWAKQGWSLGSLTSVHINVEVGGGAGTIDFPVANVTATSH